MKAGASVDLAPPRGMRDFYPHQAGLREILFNTWSHAARCHGFERYDACIVENLSLLKRKAGEEIVDQIYAFRDKSQRELALRPEITPSLARMVCAGWNDLTFPLKWFSIGQCFRYERMSRGRKREHYQWNLDVIGAPGPAPEVELLTTALSATEELGLGPAIRVHISNRELLSDLLAYAGIPAEHHAALFLVLDKRGKLSDDAITDMLVDSGFTTEAAAKVFELFELDSLDAVRRLLGRTTAALEHSAAVFEGLTTYGWENRICFDLSVVRGLNYYTGTVFEAFDVDRRFRAVFGGGRYDHLLEHIGGRPAPAVGLGFGDVVVTEIMNEIGCAPSVPAAADTVVGYMEADQSAIALRVAHQFRRLEERVDLAMGPEKARAFFGRANHTGARNAIYIGPDDVKTGHIRRKDLEQRTETTISLRDLTGDAS